MRIIVCVAFAIVLAGSSTPGAAQNLVSNPGFDDNLDGWGDMGLGEVSHDSGRDADGSPTSGSAAFESGAVLGGMALQQCIDGIIGGATYEFGGQILVRTLPLDSSAFVSLLWQDGDCATGDDLTSAETSGVSDDTWQAVSGSAVAPPGAAAVFIRGAFLSREGEYRINYDNFYLRLAGPDPVPAMSAMSLGVLTLLLLAAVAVRLRAFRQAPA